MRRDVAARLALLLRQLTRTGIIQPIGEGRLRIPDVDQLCAVAYGA